MTNLAITEIKAFVPALDFDCSKRFYAALGFEIPWSSDRLAHVRRSETSFLLQAFEVPEFAKNFQMHMLVSNADDWHRHVVHCDVERQFNVSVGLPETRPWGMRDFTLYDPSGVVWRIAQKIAADR